MAKTIVRILKLEPPFPDVKNPNRTLFIDATAANDLEIETLISVGEIKNILFKVRDKNILMNGVLHSLEFPSGDIIRLTNEALKFFNLKSGKRYWVDWNNEEKTLTVIREVTGK